MVIQMPVPSLWVINDAALHVQDEQLISVFHFIKSASVSGDHRQLCQEAGAAARCYKYRYSNCCCCCCCVTRSPPLVLPCMWTPGTGCVSIAGSRVYTIPVSPIRNQTGSRPAQQNAHLKFHLNEERCAR